MNNVIKNKKNKIYILYIRCLWDCVRREGNERPLCALWHLWINNSSSHFHKVDVKDFILWKGKRVLTCLWYVGQLFLMTLHF